MNLISWYYPTGLLQMAKVLWYTIIWLWESFSIPQLAKTLFLPWRRDVVYLKHPSLQQIFQVFALNLTSRFFGLIIRSITLLAGLIITALAIIINSLIFIILCLLPISLPLVIITSIILISRDPLSPLGYLAILLSLTAIILAGWIFQKEYIENPPLPEPLTSAIAKLHRSEKINLAPFLNYEARKIFLTSRSLEALRKNLLKSPKARFIFSRTNIHPASLNASIKLNVNAEKFLLLAGEQAIKEKHQRIQPGDLILALAQIDPSFQTSLKKANLTIDDLAHIVYWQTHLWEIVHPLSILTQPHSLKTTGGIAKNWSAGYTPRLDEFSHDITDEVTNEQLDHIYQAHQNNINQIEMILSRPGKHNCLLVGASGVGKRQIVLGLARRILIGKTLRQLAHKRVVELNLNTLLSSVRSTHNLEQRLVRVFNEAVSAGNIVLFIDNIERLFYGQHHQLGSIDAIPIILPFLNSNRLQLIGTTYYQNFHRFLEEQPALLQAFEKIEIKEPNHNQTIRILEEIVPITA